MNAKTNAQLLRRMAGKSQDEIAQAVGISREEVSRVERGYRRPSKPVCDRLALALDTDPAQLLEVPEAV